MPARASMTRRAVLARGAAASTLLAAGPSWAQGDAWSPSKPIRMISPFPPGGTTDLVARLMAQYLSEALGQPVVVENKAGAAGTIGMEALVRAPPDGHTLSVIASTHAAAPSLQPKLPYDASGGVLSLAMITKVGLVLVTAPTRPYPTAVAFIEAARREPGKLTLASAGAGNANHLVIEFLKQATGVDIVHVPYRGGGPAMNDVMGGQVDGMFNPVSSVLPLVTGGRLKVLAITSRQRAKALPTVPTMDEAGVRNFESYEWYGLTAPAGLPAPVVERYARDLGAILGRPETIAKLGEQGLEITFEGPAGFRSFFDGEVRKVREFVTSRNIQVE